MAGGSNPPGQDVRLYNAGGGDLGAQSLVGITYGSGSGWLAASLASSTLGLSVNLSGLAAGTFNASVEVGSANGGNESVAVTLVVAGPALTLSSRNVSFSAEEGGTASPASISVNLSNTGAGDFSALGAITLGATSYGGAGGWLTKALAGGSTRVDLSASPAGLGPGTYTATVPVNSAYGGSGSISVLAYVSRAADAPALALSASSVGFTALLGGASPAPKTINLSNSGGGTLASLGTLGIGSITYGAGSPGWLSSSALSGGTLTLSPATGSLGNGIHTANVSVTSQNGGNQAVTVTVEVGEPVLTASTLGLAFSGKPGGPPPGTQTVTFSNTGAGGLLDLGPTTVSSINYGAGGSGWLRNPSVGEAVVGGSLEFSVDQAVLPAGSYTSTALISSQNGGSQSITLTLTSVRETDPPRMVLSATAQRFDALVGGANPEAQQVVASNAGGGALGTLTLGPPVYGGGATGWLSADVNQNTVTTRTLTGSLSKGTYTATVPVSSNGGEATIAVNFVVGTSRLTVSPRTVSLGDTVGGGGPDPVTVGISNTGGGTFGSLGAVSLHPTLYEGSAGDWLAATLLAADSVRIRASTGNLPAAPKSYRARVPVVSALGGRDTVVVSFTVAPGTSPPRLSLSLDSMTFAGIWGGAIPPAQTLEASNSGGGEMGALSIGDVAYREGTEGWVDASVSDRSITFQAMVDALPPGTHRATVPILSAHGGESSLEVAVVLSQPSLRLSTRTVTFSDTVASPDTLRAQVFISNTGAGNRASLGPITLGTIDHPPGTPRWLATIPDPQGVVEGFLVAFEASASGLQEGSWQARVPVLSRWGGGDTVAVMLSVREPDRSFDLPTIEFVKDTLVDGVTVRRSLVGDSLTVGPLAGGSAVRIGVRNGSKTRVALSGLRVGIPSYADAQPGGWITGAFLSRTTATFDEPAELIVVLDPAGLPPGRYEGRLVISSETPALEQVSPKVLRVVLVLG